MLFLFYISVFIHAKMYLIYMYYKSNNVMKAKQKAGM